MARIRTIKPEFPQSETTGRMSRDARLLFIQLWTICDDYGRCRAMPRFLAGQLYPYDDDASALIPKWLDELESARVIARYSVDGNSYLEVENWAKHQRVDNAGKSSIPPRPDDHTPPPRREPPRAAANVGDPPLDLGVGPRTKEEDNLASLDCAQERAAPEPEIKKPVSEKPKRAKPKTRIGEDAQPCEADKAKADEVGMNGATFRHEWQKFRDYHLREASQMADWPAAWRTWCAGWLDRGGKQCVAPSGCAVPAAAVSGFYAARETPQWIAWDLHKRAATGRGLPADPKGGWWVESEWPPGYSPPATVANISNQRGAA